MSARRALGVAVRGAFHPEPGELAAALPGRRGHRHALGIYRQPSVAAFRALGRGKRRAAATRSTAGRDGSSARWRANSARSTSTRAIRPCFPSSASAGAASPVHPSPIGLLIHPRWGLWHAYRGALVFEQRDRVAGHFAAGRAPARVRSEAVPIGLPGARVSRRLIRPRCLRASRAERRRRGLPRGRLPRTASVSRGRRIPLPAGAGALSYRGLPALDGSKPRDASAVYDRRGARGESVMPSGELDYSAALTGE